MRSVIVSIDTHAPAKISTLLSQPLVSVDASSYTKVSQASLTQHSHLTETHSLHFIQAFHFTSRSLPLFPTVACSAQLCGMSGFLSLVWDGVLVSRSQLLTNVPDQTPEIRLKDS